MLKWQQSAPPSSPSDPNISWRAHNWSARILPKACAWHITALAARCIKAKGAEGSQSRHRALQLIFLLAFVSTPGWYRCRGVLDSHFQVYFPLHFPSFPISVYIQLISFPLFSTCTHHECEGKVLWGMRRVCNRGRVKANASYGLHEMGEWFEGKQRRCAHHLISGSFFVSFPTHMLKRIRCSHDN